MKFFTVLKQVVKNSVLAPFYKKPKVISCEETIDYIIKNKVSIGRFGDGELSVMLGGDVGFQEADPDLAKKLAMVKNTSNFLTCIPNIFDKKYFSKKLIKKDEYLFWVKNKMKFQFAWGKYFNKNEFCGDAFISRFYMRFNDRSGVAEYIEKLKKLWEGKNLIIVEGETSFIGVGNDIFKNAKSIKRIIGPNVNANQKYDQIYDAVKNNYTEDSLVLMALGPTATYLAYDLSKIGVWSLDLGHFDIEYEWFLLQTPEKVPIRNKHVNECNAIGGTESDKEYLSQIVARIK